MSVTGPHNPERPTAAIIRLRGEHDVATAPSLTRAFDRMVARDDADLVVDLSGVQFMGAATIGAIVRVRESLRVIGPRATRYVRQSRQAMTAVSSDEP